MRARIPRLLTIFLVIYFFRIKAGMAVHIYLGYSFFIVWVLLFWAITFKYLLKPIESPYEPSRTSQLDKMKLKTGSEKLHESVKSAVGPTKEI